MKKDDIIKGLDAVDDDLIAEAAGKTSHIRYRTRIRLIRILIGTAAAAAMVATGVLLHTKANKPPEETKEHYAAGISDESGKPEEVTVTSAVTSIPYDGTELYAPLENYSNDNFKDVVNVKFRTGEYPDKWVNCTPEQADYILDSIASFKSTPASGIYEPAPGAPIVRMESSDGSCKDYCICGGDENYPGIIIIYSDEGEESYNETSGASAGLCSYLQEEFAKVKPYLREYEYTTYAVTTTRTDTDIVTEVTTVTKDVTMPDTTEPVTTTVPWTEERPFIYNGRENTFYPPMKNYSYPGDPTVTNVQFGTAVLRDRGVWVNCSFDQADRILNAISAFRNSDEIEDIGFEGGGFCVKVIYDDGTSREYELFGTLGIYYLKDKDGSTVRMKDTSGVENDLVWYLQDEFMKIDPYITAFFEEKYG